MRNRTRKTVYILTEGETEVAYFSRIADDVNNADEWKYSLTVEVRNICEGVRQDPVGMVKEAKFEKKDKDYWKVWVVFDKDRERDDKNREAFELAKKHEINIAFSSISFEHWLILHFEKNNFAFERSDCESRSTKTDPVKCSCKGTICALSYLKRPELYPTYKKGKSLVYDDLKERNQSAIENAAWLRKKQSPFTHIHLLNPYSDVDFILSEVLGLKMVEYVLTGEEFTFEGVKIKINKYLIQNNLVEVSISINNQSGLSFPMNNNQSFLVCDHLNRIFKYNIAEPKIVPSGNKYDCYLRFSIFPDSNNLIFKAMMQEKYYITELF